nr:translation initiation factor IF-2-like [Ovis aries]
MKEFNLRQVKAEQDRAARRAGVSRRKEQLPGRQRVERPRPLIPACPAMRGPHPGPPLPSRLLGPAPPPRPGRGATTAGRRRARATRRLTSPGCATPSMEERKRGRNNVGGERGERNGEAEAGARPEPGELLGRARGRGGWERGERLASVCGSSGASAMVAEPLRGCCTDPPPTPRSGPAHLAVSRPAIGATWSDEQGGLANGRRRAGRGGGASLSYFSLSLSLFFFFLFLIK